VLATLPREEGSTPLTTSQADAPSSPVGECARFLTGHGPYRLETGKPLEVLRAIVEQEPEPPSVAVDRTVRFATSEGQGRAALTPGRSAARGSAPPSACARGCAGGVWPSHWVLLLGSDSALRAPELVAASEPLAGSGGQRLWTDQYSNILSVGG